MNKYIAYTKLCVPSTLSGHLNCIVGDVEKVIRGPIRADLGTAVIVDLEDIILRNGTAMVSICHD